MLEHVNVPAALVSLLAILAGIVLLIVSDTGDTAAIVGFLLLGLGGIAITALAFYAVGRSEDAERAREERRP